jgi:hypothetical protein
MKCHYLIALVTASSLFFSACNKNDKVTNSNVTYQITTEGSSQSGRVSTADDAGSRTEGLAITWTGGYINTSEIKFEAKGDNNIEFKSKAVTYIDLFDAANAIAAIGDIEVVPGTYEKIVFKTKLEPVGSLAAFELTGFYAINGDTVPVVLRLDQPIELKFEKKTPTTIDANAGFTVLNTLSLDLLASSISLQMLSDAVLANNKIIISAKSNPALFKLMVNVMDGILKVKIKKK